MPLLDVAELSVRYQSPGAAPVAALERVSFSVESGEVVAVVGESGSGKSSLALALTRLLPSPPAAVSARHVRFEDRELLGASEAALQRVRGGRIAYVFQDPASSLNPVLTIGEQLREMIERHTDRRGREADALAIEWLERVGIPEAAQRLGAYPHEFSGGMQQRVMIAMAMAARPSLLIADEPTTALDVTVQVQILRLLRDLQRVPSEVLSEAKGEVEGRRPGMALLLISHDLLVVERLAQRVLVLAQGRIVESGPVAQVLSAPAHPYTKQLLAARPLVRLRPQEPPHA